MRAYSRTLAIASVSLALSLGAALGRPQDPLKPSSDDALDNLLKKVEQAESGKPADAKPAPTKPGEVAPKDQALDSLLEKLGETKDEPTKSNEPPPDLPGAAGEDEGKSKSGDQPKPKSKSKSEQAKPKDLTGETKKLDEHLEELTGRRRRQDRQKQQGQGEGQSKQAGPLDDLVKEMRDVEERLSKPDTGEQTRQKQGEIVKRLDTMIDAMKKASSRSQAMRQMRQGRQPGQQQGDQPGAQATGPPPSKPERPKGKSVLALDKNSWGNLPPDVRAELENVFKEEPLPSRDDLIKRYYLSVSRKSMAREE